MRARDAGAAAALAGLLLASTAGSGAAGTKLSPGLRARRAAGAFPLAAGAAAAGPGIPALLRLRTGVTLGALQSAYPAVQFGTEAGGIATAVVPASALDAFEKDPRILYVEASGRASPTLDVARSSYTEGGIIQGTLVNGPADLANIDGTGVIVAFIDSGLDFKHEDFIGPGNTSRVLYLWDQTDLAGPPPGTVGSQTFTLGTEWTQAQLTANIQTGIPAVSQQDTFGHGTHVAGIAAGNGSATNGVIPAGTFKGMAPKADLIVVKTDFFILSVIDGVRYVAARAAAAGKPAVIVLAVSWHLDPHDGTSLFDQAIDGVAANTPVVVSMGNARGTAPHEQVASTPFNGVTAFTLKTTDLTAEAVMDIWTQPGDSYRVDARFRNDAGTIDYTIGVDPGLESVPRWDGTQMSYVGNQAGNQDPYGSGTDGSGVRSNEIYVDVFNSAGITVSSMTVSLTCLNAGGCGRLDAFTDPSSLKTQFLDTPYITETLTLGAPATALNVFSVGAFYSKQYVDGGSYQGFPSTPADGSITPFSSWGPTRDNRPKPDVAAPGQWVASSMSNDALANFPTVVRLPDERHAVMQGTSMAAPVVAGILATRLQAVPTRTVAQLRAILTGLARTDAKVTLLGPNAVHAFGAGKVTATPRPLSAPTGLAGTPLGVSSITWTWNATTLSADAYDLYYATEPTTALALGVLPPFAQQGLAPNTTYGILVRGEGGGLEGPASAAASTATPAVAPAQTAASFPAVWFSSVTLAWGRNGNPLGTTFYAELSAFSDFSSAVLSSVTFNGSATFTALVPNLRYYGRVSAVSVLGLPTAYSSLGSTVTLVVPPTLPGQPFSGTSADGFTFTFNQNGNSALTSYTVRISTDPNLSPVTSSVDTTANSASFAGLRSNKRYYAGVAAIDQGDVRTAFTGAVSTATVVSTPIAVAFQISTRTIDSIGFAWASGALATGTRYLAEASSSPVFAFGIVSSDTANTFATFATLPANTTFYARVRALSLNPPTPDGPALSPAGYGSTYSDAPAAAAEPFPGVFCTSVTVAWVALPAQPQSATAESYVAQLSTASDFSGTLFSSATAPGAASASVGGLSCPTTYYARIGGLNWESLATYRVLATTVMTEPPVSTGAASGAGLMLAVQPSYPQITWIEVYVPPNAFPAGTQVRAVANLGMTLDAPRANAGDVAALGPTVGIDLSAGGLQPAAAVRVTMRLDVGQLPSGRREDSLRLFRYDPALGAWVLVPSQMDAVSHTLVAFVPHFSKLAPMFFVAAAGLSAVQVFPQPWEVGDPSSPYWAQDLTISNTPAGAHVRILTLTGETVFDGWASSGGNLTWNGSNRLGRWAASGTYYAVVESGGTSFVRRVVVIR